MKRTRNLFLIQCSPECGPQVLNSLKFKGLANNPPGRILTTSLVQEAFKHNRSVVALKDDFMGLPNHNIVNVIHVEDKNYVFSDNIPFLYRSKDDNYATQFARLAEKFGYDIGDMKSDTPDVDSPDSASCAYCRYLSGSSGDNTRIMYKSENFFVFPTLGQIREGYLLIIPYNHILSIGKMNPEVYEEFSNVLTDCEYLLKLTYGCSHVIVWENGSGNTAKGKAKDSIVHAHVHVCPSLITSDMIKDHLGLKFDRIQLSDLPLYSEDPYLLVRAENQKQWDICCAKDVYIPRQYVRQIIAEEIGFTGEEWNWRYFPFTDKMISTVENVTKAAIENWNSLPDRIKKNIVLE